MVPPYRGSHGLAQAVKPHGGNLKYLIMSIFRLESAPFNIYSIGGLVWVLTTFYYPYAFITTLQGHGENGPSLEEASRILRRFPL